MKRYVPILKLRETQTPDSFAEQFGGVPWGLPEEKWPVCRGCGVPMALLAQFKHHRDRLDLGKEGRVLYLFMCTFPREDVDPLACNIWEADGGGNDVIILDPQEIIPGPTPEPSHELFDSLPAIRVEGWIEEEECVLEEWLPWFLDNKKWMDIPDAVIENLDHRTKLGRVPIWIQYAEYHPAYRFVGQIDYRLELTGPLRHPDLVERSCDGRISWEIRSKRGRFYEITPSEEGTPSYWFDLPLLYDAGCGYLFVNPDPEKPSGIFTVQTC